jgi:cold shock CspA family protein
MSTSVKFGVNSMTLNLSGKSIGDIRSQIGGLLGLGGGETAKVNGVNMADSVAVSDGDSIEFVKESGQKGSVDVSAGVNKVTLNLAGQTVSAIKSQLSSILNLGGDEIAKVNGVDIAGDVSLYDGDKVEFVKKSGQKGSVTVKFDGKTITGDYDGQTIEDVVNDLDGMGGFPSNYEAKVNGNDAQGLARETARENGEDPYEADADGVVLEDGDELVFNEERPYVAPPPTSTSSTVKIRCGVNAMDVGTLIGKTPNDARSAIGGLMGVDADMTAKVNGIDASCGQVLKAGDTLEFVKTSGQKG